jgi:hypothetical protein
MQGSAESGAAATYFNEHAEDVNYVTLFMQYIKIDLIFKVLQDQFSVFNFNNQIYFHFADFTFIVNDPFQRYKIHVSLYSKIPSYSIFWGGGLKSWYSVGPTLLPFTCNLKEVMKITDHPYVFATQTPVQHLCALQMCELGTSDWQYSKAGGCFLLFVTVGQPL